MDPPDERQGDAGKPQNYAGPPLPTTTMEFINIVAHYHRGEIARMAGWRDRIDRTTNWAITVVAAMLSVSLSTPTSHHGVLIFAMLLVFLLLSIEARRYRFFDVYRARVRGLERNYFAQIFAPSPQLDKDWARVLGDDLRKPQFLVTHLAAMSRRLRRNYIWMFLILLLAWLLKITTSKMQQGGGQFDFVESFGEIPRNAALGPASGWVVVLAVIVFYAWLVYASLRTYEQAGELAHGKVHV
jgi:uncharacterized membrane protein